MRTVLAFAFCALTAGCSGGDEATDTSSTDPVDDTDVEAANPCIEDETFTLVDNGEGALAIGYCPGFTTACGTVGPECGALEFVREADETYTVYGLNFNLFNQSHGVPAAQTISAWGELPADTVITMDVRISMPPPTSPERTGNLELTFSGTEVTVHTFNDPWLE